MKYILFISVFLSLLHVYLSFFVVHECILNEGIAFGIYVPYIRWISLVLLFVLFVLSIRTKSNIKYILFSITMFGGLNVFERFVRGYICDYINISDIYVNIADICITVLIVLLVLICIFRKDGCKNN